MQIFPSRRQLADHPWPIGFTGLPRFLCNAALMLTVLVLLSPATVANAGSSSVRIIDGDTLELDGERIRLEGIDAPENAQTCDTADGTSWPCGKAARSYLVRLASRGPVTCSGQETDAYGRLIATCHAGDVDLNRTMVHQGMALAFRKYSTTYVADEDRAKARKTGLWAGRFVAPWDYRAGKWKAASETVPEDCPIKGNITGRGRIYHTPWSPHYARTRINEAKGERWFCTEAEALAAGWRAPE